MRRCGLHAMPLQAADVQARLWARIDELRSCLRSTRRAVWIDPIRMLLRTTAVLAIRIVVLNLVRSTGVRYLNVGTSY